MKRFAMLSVVVMLLAGLPLAGWGQVSKPPGTATGNQDHGNIGVYLDFTRLQPASLNLFGVGGRIGFNVHRSIVLEAEMAYDFQRTQTFAVTAGNVTSTVTSNLRMYHFLFGPKIKIPHSTHFFILAKGGFVNFGVTAPVTVGAISNQLAGIVNGNIDTAFFPGGAVEFRRGHLGIRAEAGDELIHFSNGYRSNFRATAGPEFRF